MDFKKLTRIELGRRLGSGAAGIVYAISDTEACKIEVADKETLLRERAVLNECDRHSLFCVARLYGGPALFTFKNAQFSYHVMERLDYGLDSLVGKATFNDTLKLTEACLLGARNVFEIGIYPGDIKAQNIMFKLRRHSDRYPDKLVFCDTGHWVFLDDTENVTLAINEAVSFCVSAITAMLRKIHDGTDTDSLNNLIRKLSESVHKKDSKAKTAPDLINLARIGLIAFLEETKRDVKILQGPYDWQKTLNIPMR